MMQDQVAVFAGLADVVLCIGGEIRIRVGRSGGGFRRVHRFLLMRGVTGIRVGLRCPSGTAGEQQRGCQQPGSGVMQCQLFHV